MTDVFRELHQRFTALCVAHHLMDREIEVRAKVLTPEEAIGHPESNDFPLQKGKERLMQAEFDTGIGQAFSFIAIAIHWDVGGERRGMPHIRAQALVQSTVGLFDAVGDGLQSTLGKELPLPADENVRAALPLAIGPIVVWIDALTGLGVIAVPAQDVRTRTPDQQVRQQLGQPALPGFDQAEKVPQVRRIDRQVSHILQVKEAKLVIDVPHRLVARRRSQEHAAPVAKKLSNTR